MDMTYIIIGAIVIGMVVVLWYLLRSTTWYDKVWHWLFDVKEEKSIARSKYHKFIEKLPLLMAMYGSSVLVAISTYNTFPSFNPYLRYSSAAIGGAAFDVILTVTVFSLRKNKFSLLTIIAALITGLSIALDLYMNLGMQYLHATYIIMATLFALHLSTTRGLNIDELDAKLTDAENTTSRLEQTNAQLTAENSKLLQTLANQEQITTDLTHTVDNYKEIMLEKLCSIDKLTANEIISLLGGDRTTMLAKIREYRKSE